MFHPLSFEAKSKMTDQQASTGPINTNSRRVLDVSGTGCRRLSPSDSYHDSEIISCMDHRDMGGDSEHTYADMADLGMDSGSLVVNAESYCHMEEVGGDWEDGSSRPSPSNLKIGNVRYDPSLHKRLVVMKNVWYGMGM